MEAFFEDYLTVLHTLNREFIATFDTLPAEALDWIPGADMNSFCVLVVHTTASARFWIGDITLGESSNRNRDSEFKAKGLSREQLIARFTDLEAYVSTALGRITPADLTGIHAASPDRQVTGNWALLHALEHTGLHLGHAQITRQLWDQR